jgi:hypothetical protein
MQYIKDQGWPKPTKQLSPDKTVLRSAAYEILDIISKKIKAITLADNIGVSEFLFISLQQDPFPEAVQSITEAIALNGMPPADGSEKYLSDRFAEDINKNHRTLENILLEEINIRQITEAL